MAEEKTARYLLDLAKLHEFSSIIIPGAVLEYGLILFYPNLGSWLPKGNIETGTLLFFLLMAYPTGFVVQATANKIEKILIENFLSKDLKDKRRINNIIPKSKVDKLLKRLKIAKPKKLTICQSIKNYLKTLFGVKSDEQFEWEMTIRKMKSKLEEKEKEKANTFNNNNKLCRGLSTSLLLLTVIDLIKFNGQITQFKNDFSLLFISLLTSTIATFIYMRNFENRELQVIYQNNI